MTASLSLFGGNLEKELAVGDIILVRLMYLGQGGRYEGKKNGQDDADC